MIFIVISIIEFIIICGIIFYIAKTRVSIRKARADAIKRSRSVIEGQVFEQIVAYLPQWKFTPSEARFIGDPIDYVVFDGMSEGEIKNIVIAEIKKGNSHTSPIQNKIKKAVEEGRVRWETIKLE